MTSPAPTTDDVLAEVKRRARETWAAGDYDAIADGIWEAGEVVVRAAGVAAGDRVLDVACGTGNAATRAALAGGRVTGLDLTPEMFEAGRRRADAAGVAIEFVAGDAEDLPFDDGTFDVVLSTFGVMFAPRHEVAARQMARVLRPGGRIGLATWTPEGSVGGLFATVARHLPPPPAIAASPLLWGSEAHVRELFAGTGIDPAFTREHLQLDPDLEVAQATEFYLASFGPLIKAREALEPGGAWDALRAELEPVIEGLLQTRAEYLVITGVKA